jgi:hypothetical protein
MKLRAILKGVTALLVACVLIFAFKVWEILRGPDLTPRKLMLEEIPGDFRLKRAAPLEDAHLLDEEFKIVRRVNEILSSYMSTFEYSFVTINNFPPRPGQFRLANPGEPFQWSDLIAKEELPFRRLEFAGWSGSKCFIHYQMGLQGSAFCLAVIDSAKYKIWVGKLKDWEEGAAKDLPELQRKLIQRRFWNGTGC